MTASGRDVSPHAAQRSDQCGQRRQKGHLQQYFAFYRFGRRQQKVTHGQSVRDAHIPVHQDACK